MEQILADNSLAQSSYYYYFLSLVCGIQPAGPGFENVRIAPEPGVLEKIEGKFPHRLGTISLTLRKDGQGQLAGTITLPRGLNGTYEYRGQRLALKPGENVIP